LALNSFYVFAGLGFSIWTIVIGHATFCVVVVYNNVLARLRRSPGSLIEASQDLGADGWQTFRFVVWPVLSTALVAGGLLAFALSFDEVVVTTFTAGAQSTLPIFILDNLRQGQQLPVISPATGEVIAEVPRCGAEDVDRAIDAAKAALPRWLDTTPKERSELLHKLADVLEENAEELAQIESRNVGKPLMASRDEMPFSADNLRFFAGAARHLEGKSAGEYIAGYTSIIRREPLGIVGGICPWNYPLMMAIWKMGPALAAGNVQVLKPSEQTPLSLLRFVQLAQEVIPAGVLNVVTGDGVPVGERLVSHPDVRLVSLTGDVSTGKAIARNDADTLKRVHLELGGKARMVVFDDADPVAVAAGTRLGGN